MPERPTKIELRANRRLREDEYTIMAKQEPGFLRTMLRNQQCVELTAMTTIQKRNVIRAIRFWMARNATDFYAFNDFSEGATELLNIQCYDENDALQLRLHLHGVPIDD